MAKKQKQNPRESVITWINSKERNFSQGLQLLEELKYKPHVVKQLKAWGNIPRSANVMLIEMRNCLRELHRQKPETKIVDELKKGNTDAEFITNLEKELQKEYPGVIKQALTEFHSLYQSRSILHKELKAIGESNDEKSTTERKHKLTLIDSTSRRMDTLWGIFDKYKKDSSLPEASFFDEPFDLEKVDTTGHTIPGYKDFVLPEDLEGLKKLKENLRIKISKAENRLEYQSEKKGETSNPMPEGPKRADLVKKMEEWNKQKTAVEYKIVELK